MFVKIFYLVIEIVCTTIEEFAKNENGALLHNLNVLKRKELHESLSHPEIRSFTHNCTIRILKIETNDENSIYSETKCIVETIDINNFILGFCKFLENYSSLDVRKCSYALDVEKHVTVIPFYSLFTPENIILVDGKIRIQVVIVRDDFYLQNPYTTDKIVSDLSKTCKKRIIYQLRRHPNKNFDSFIVFRVRSMKDCIFCPNADPSEIIKLRGDFIYCKRCKKCFNFACINDFVRLLFDFINSYKSLSKLNVVTIAYCRSANCHSYQFVSINKR